KVELKPEPKVELKPEPKVELKPEPKVELKPEPKVELKPEILIEKKQEQKISEEDPFAGISTKDIEKYSDLFDVPPPENDDQAIKLASDIKKWISKGRPKVEEQKDELKIENEIKETEDEKPKKKHSLFGWRKK
ncbi:MAG TPA: signal recognition particle-docking protein FtsY, partial [Candidatus Nitrosotalea sp.]|nr:signal recognition particle-docking protein FtsY [Candidatus Nitrosotalea sp.]